MNSSLTNILKGGVLAAALAFVTTPAQAVPVTITFGTSTGTPLSYTEDIMTVTSQHGVNPHIHLVSGGNPGSALRNHDGCCSTPYLFTFSGMQVDLITVDFKGTGGNLFTTDKGGSFSYPGSTGWVNPGTIVDPLFKGITWLKWEQTSGDLKIDNLVFEKSNVNPVPEPGTVLLLGTGLAGVVAWRMRKAQA